MLELKGVTKIYQSGGLAFLTGLGDLFEKGNNRQTVGLLRGIWNQGGSGAPAQSLAQRARALGEKLFFEDESLVTALKSVDLDIARGEFLALAGPSGSGKTTLLNILGTLEAPTQGLVIFDGHDLTGLDENERAAFRRAYLGFVFQAFNLIPVLSAYENIEYALILKQVSSLERRRRIMEALGFVGLTGMEHRKPDKLSGGQQQRVAIARALAVDPRLVLADEPTANLDSKTAAGILDLMEQSNRDKGTTFIFSSHDAAVLERARRVVFLRDGEVVRVDNKAAPRLQ